MTHEEIRVARRLRHACSDLLESYRNLLSDFGRETWSPCDLDQEPDVIEARAAIAEARKVL